MFIEVNYYYKKNATKRCMVDLHQVDCIQETDKDVMITFSSGYKIEVTEPYKELTAQIRLYNAAL